jgi:hypothetical protein
MNSTFGFSGDAARLVFAKSVNEQITTMPAIKKTQLERGLG